MYYESSQYKAHRFSTNFIQVPLKNVLPSPRGVHRGQDINDFSNGTILSSFDHAHGIFAPTRRKAALVREEIIKIDEKEGVNDRPAHVHMTWSAPQASTDTSLARTPSSSLVVPLPSVAIEAQTPCPEPWKVAPQQPLLRDNMIPMTSTIIDPSSRAICSSNLITIPESGSRNPHSAVRHLLVDQPDAQEQDCQVFVDLQSATAQKALLKPPPPPSVGNHKDCVTKPQGLESSHHEYWLRRYQEMIEYRTQFGHCKVPTKVKGLRDWVYSQRKMYWQQKSGIPNPSLTVDKIKALDDIGFCWKTNLTKNWESRFEEFQEFRKLNKHDRMKHPNFATLSSWAQRQRRQYQQWRTTGRSTSMTEDRYNRLISIGFPWKGD